ncbi:hypothetical protein, partial [Xanthomonas phaseoli]
KRDEVVDERWKRRFIWQLPVFTKEIGFCESFSHVCRLSPEWTLAGIATQGIDECRCDLAGTQHAPAQCRFALAWQK